LKSVIQVFVLSGLLSASMAVARPRALSAGTTSTVTDLSASATMLTAGQPLTLIATVTAASGPTPTGTVNFLYAGKSLGTASPNASGVATITMITTVGQFSITASYSGNAIDASSASNTVGVTVTALPTAAPNIYVYAGNGNPGANGDGCSATTAELDPVFSLASDTAGNLYIADFESNRIRRIDHATGIITTVAGNGTKGFSGDSGQATSAELNAPYGVALDTAGNLYIADTENFRIRKVVLATGIITTVAGTGTLGFSGDGELATSGQISYVYGLATDAQGNLYIGDDSNFRVRKINAVTDIITTVAGNGSGGYGGDGGPAVSAQLFGYLAPALDGSGNIYISDTNNNRIRKVNAATGIITTIAGDGVQGYGGDNGPATSAELYMPDQIASDAAGNITIADVFNNRVRRVDAATGIITTVAGDGVQGFGPISDPAIYAELNEPTAVALDAAGNIYIDVNGVTQILIVGAEPNFPLIATATDLVAAPPTLLSGQTLTLTATVSAPTCTTPAGTVSLYNGAASLGSASLNGSGVATLPLTPAVGNYSITASYSGSSIDAPSQSAPPVEVTVNSALISTTTSLTALSATTLTVGQTLTVLANVSPASGVTPTGEVTFYNGPNALGTGQLNASGQETLQLMLAVGSYSITASYGGSAIDAPSTSSPTVKVTVKPAQTTTTLAEAPTVLSVGQMLTLTATVTASSGVPPQGTVTFKFVAPADFVQPVVSLNANGIATATISTLPAGVYRIFASYGGSSTDAPSQSSPPVTVIVTTPATTTSLTASPNPAAFGANVIFTAKVTNPTLTPTGAVSFYEGRILLGTETLASGAAIYSTSALSAGSHNITAVYAPTPAFSASTSAVFVEFISIASFNIVAAPASRTVYAGESTSYLVAVTPITGFALPVALSCSQPPANTTCKFTPATIAGGSGTSVVAVQTTAPSPSTDTTTASTSNRMTALAALFLFVIPWRPRRNRNVWSAFILIFAFFLATAVITACGGGGSLSGGTPVGADTITITGTATDGLNSLSQQTTVTLNVKSLF
jgi:large repetitive protein